MSMSPDRRAIVTACMRSDGTPAFAFIEVVVTADEATNGVHYPLAEIRLLAAGYEEPFVHFDEVEAPPFLHAAVRQALGLPPATTAPQPLVLSENS
jgi:hypothetical protein